HYYHLIAQISLIFSLSFFFNHTPTTEIYTLSLHDALPIWIGVLRRRDVPSLPTTSRKSRSNPRPRATRVRLMGPEMAKGTSPLRSEEHTSELQSLRHLVCRLLLEKKKKTKKKTTVNIPKQT